MTLNHVILPHHLVSLKTPCIVALFIVACGLFGQVVCLRHQLNAHVVSKRGGFARIEVTDERVFLSSKAIPDREDIMGMNAFILV